MLDVNSVYKSFGGVQANKNISLHVPNGKIIGLIGPNGSGKTTLFNSIVGYHAIDSGSIKFEGKEISQLMVAQIARLGLLRTFQQTRIYNNMNCIENLQISLTHVSKNIFSLFKPVSEADLNKIEELLRFVGLYEKRLHLAGNLSFGQQKLLELAMALIVEPKLLLLDEPTAGINPTLITALMERLQYINRELGITLLIIEHNMRVIMSLANHVYCLAHGQLLAEGSPEQIQTSQMVIDAYLGEH